MRGSRCCLWGGISGCAQFAHTTPCDAMSDVPKTYYAKKKKKTASWEHNGQERRSNTGDKRPDRLAAQTHMHTRIMCVIE